VAKYSYHISLGDDGKVARTSNREA